MRYNIVENGPMIDIHIYDGFNGVDLMMVVKKIIEMEEDKYPVPYKHVIVHAEEVDLNVQDLLPQAMIRRVMEYCTQFKTSIRVNNIHNFAIARMWQILMHSPDVEIGIFYSIDESIEWLE